MLLMMLVTGLSAAESELDAMTASQTWRPEILVFPWLAFFQMSPQCRQTGTRRARAVLSLVGGREAGWRGCPFTDVFGLGAPLFSSISF